MVAEVTIHRRQKVFWERRVHILSASEKNPCPYIYLVFAKPIHQANSFKKSEVHFRSEWKDEKNTFISETMNELFRDGSCNRRTPFGQTCKITSKFSLMRAKYFRYGATKYSVMKGDIETVSSPTLIAVFSWYHYFIPFEPYVCKFPPLACSRFQICRAWTNK